MVGNIAQLVALVSHGNKYLQTGELERTFFATNSTFQYCNRVDFRISTKLRLFFRGGIAVIAGEPNSWFEQLRGDDCQRLNFKYQHSAGQSLAPDYMLAGLNGGGGVWFAEAKYHNHSTYWTNFWDVAEPSRTDQRIWSVSYFTDGRKHQNLFPNYDLTAATAELDHVLSEIKHFADTNDLSEWGKEFEVARQTLRSEAPELGFYHSDMLATEMHTLEARRLIFAAGKAWVFGGMGSWNDLGFDNEDADKTYRKLSNDLFESINDALQAGLNS